MKLALFWRILAGLSLVAFAGCVVLLGWITVSNIFLFALTLVTIVALLYAGWLVFTGKHKRRQYGWALIVLCLCLLVAEVVVLIIHGEGNGLLLLAALLGALYIVLVRLLRHQYWLQRRRLGITATSGHHYVHPVLIINPKSGDGRAIKAGVDKQAREQGIEVIITKKGDTIQDLAEQAVASGADVLGVSGGDGTLGAVAAVAFWNDLPLVVLPGGTRCHFARDIGLDPAQILDAMAAFQGVERAITVGLINDRLFMNNASFGIYADIVDHPEYREHKVATSRAVLQEVVSGKRPPYDLAFADPTGMHHKHAVQILVGVNPYQALSLLELGHRAALDTGVLQVIAVTSLSEAIIAQLLGALVLPNTTDASLPKNMLQWTAKYFEVDSGNERLVVGVDGEREVYDTPVHLRVAPHKLRLLVPPEGIRARPLTPTSPEILRELWHAMLGK